MDVTRSPARRMKFNGSSQIFRESRLVAPDLLQCSSPDKCISAKQGARVPGIHADADWAEKLICRFGCRSADETLLSIGEGLHNLHEPHPRISEVAKRTFEKFRFRCVIGIENDDDFAVGFFESMIDISRLGMFVIRAGNISGT